MNKEGYFEHALSSKNFQKAYSKEQLDHCRRQNHCPDNDKLVQEAVWLNQNMLLADKSDMDDIVDAIEKIYENREQLI